MRNQSFQMEIGTSFGVHNSALKIRTLLATLLAISFAINQSFAASPESEKGAALLLKQAAPAINLGRIRVGGRFNLRAPPGFTFDSSLWLTAPVNHEHNY